LVVTGCAALLLWGIVVAGRTSLAAKPNPNGAYDVIVAGDSNGKGRAVVNAKSVKIDATLDDGTVLSASKLPIDNSTFRFSGTGTVNATVVSVSGRIDPPDTDPDPTKRTLKNWRIVATYASTDGKCAGRVIGQR
jgi:hypothetical protein